MYLPNRQHLALLINEKGYKTGAEIGVRYGGFSDYLIKYSKIDLLWSIDPWECNVELSNNQDACDIHYLNCCKLLSKHKDRSKVLRAFSPQVCEQFDDNSLDFVYIDALHDYDSVIADINGWWPKITKGGLIGGHDLCQNSWPGVWRAVHEFANNNKLEIHRTGIGDKYGEGDGDKESWFCFKE